MLRGFLKGLQLEVVLVMESVVLSRREICGVHLQGPHHITSLRTSFLIRKEETLRTARTLGKNTPFKSHTKRLGQSLAGFSQPEATFLGQPCCLLSFSGEDPLEKEMETLSSILAWRIPWTRSLKGYNSEGLQLQTVTKSCIQLKQCSILACWKESSGLSTESSVCSS